MAVRIKFELLVPGFDTVDQLRDYVVAHDELESGADDAIAKEYVKGSHVLALYFEGKMPNVALDEGRIPTGYPWEEILVDEMEEA
jgi:hypothetical protein